jgi:hypothetical protein
MTTLTLLVKSSRAWQLKAIDEMLQTQFEELDVEARVLTNSKTKWVQIELSGEDETIATNYINKIFGACPVSVENAKAMESLNGYISQVDSNKQELRVDIGVFEPKVAQAVLSVASLQTALVNGKKFTLQQIAELFGLAEGVPVSVKVNWEHSSEEELSAELSEEQIVKLVSWQMSLLDRLIILGTSKETVTEVLERTHLGRDVIDVEALSAFDFALTCKLGTDATGLVPRMGRYMRGTVFVVFNADKLMALSIG